MKTLVAALVCSLCLAGIASAKVTCTPPFFFYGVLDSITEAVPGVVVWTVSTWPFLPCDDPGANCGDIQCFAGADCTTAALGDCFNILVSNCSDNPSIIKIRHWWAASSTFCSAE